MQDDTLFGHLMVRLPVSKENLATEALRFILCGNPALADAFSRMLASFGATAGEIATYETQQANDDGSIPDMFCRDNGGGVAAVVENKFWAGLTENQPLAYLERLQPGGVLLFVAPDQRVHSLWAELQDRCRVAAPIAPESKVYRSPYGRTADGRVLAVVGWITMLETLEAAAMRENAQAALSDLRQLMGLCRKMDAGAFLPLAADELTNLNLPRRYINFADLIREVGATCLAVGLVKSKDLAGRGLTQVHYERATGRYALIESFIAWLGVDADLWLGSGRTPFTLNFHFDEVGKGRTVLQILRTRSPDIPLFERDDSMDVLLFPPIGVEKPQIVHGLVEQVRKVRRVLADAS